MRKYFLLLMVFAALTRGYFIFTADFPLMDGGMFYSMTRDLIDNDFRLPKYISYNHDNIPFAYSPLAFYAAAVLNTVFHIPLTDIFRYIPLIVSLLSVPVIYLIALRVMPAQAALFAVLAYVTTPRSFQALILGGGLTRSFGFLFALCAVYFSIRFYKEKQNTFMAATSVFFALSVLSHLETAMFAMLSIAAVYLVFDRTRKGFIRSIGIGLGALLLTLPWWATVISRHGIAPYIAALYSNPRDYYTWPRIVLLSYMTEPKIQAGYMLSILGLIVAFLKRSYFLPVWLGMLVLSATRMIHSSGAIALAMLAGLAVHELILPGVEKLNPKRYRRNAKLTIAVLVTFMIVSFITSFGHRFTPLEYLPKQERATMEWVRKNTLPNDTFIVVSAYPGWAWFTDTTLEWFPALTERKSISTVQGYEWIPGFSDRLKLNERFKECNDEDITCLEQVAENEHVSFTHLYISKSTKLEPDLPGCCELLIDSLRKSFKYRLLYEDKGAMIWYKRI